MTFTDAAIVIVFFSDFSFTVKNGEAAVIESLLLMCSCQGSSEALSMPSLERGVNDGAW